MNYLFIKIIAIVTMLVDHIGLVLLENNITCRMIGRISFPLFCFLLVNGYFHTSNRKKYLLRMLVFACVSELLYDFTFYGGINIYSQNVFFTLTIGLLSICLTDCYKALIREKLPKTFRIFMQILGNVIIMFIFMYINEAAGADYGWYGIMLIYLFYLTYGAKVRNKILMCVSVSFVNFLKLIAIRNTIQVYSIFAITILIFFRDEKVSVPKYVKWLGYIFYPAHLLIIFILKSLL